MPSSNTCRFTALSMAVTVTITSVAVTASGAKGGQGAVAFGRALGVKPHGIRQQSLDSASLGRFVARAMFQLATT